MAKVSKKKLEAERNKRFSRALGGFVVPMMSIPAIGKLMDAAVEAGASDEELKAIVASFPGVKESV